MEKDLKNLMSEMDKIKDQNEEMYRQSLKLIENDLNVLNLEKKLDIYKDQDKPDGIVEFKARKRRA